MEIMHDNYDHTSSQPILEETPDFIRNGKRIISFLLALYLVAILFVFTIEIFILIFWVRNTNFIISAL